MADRPLFYQPEAFTQTPRKPIESRGFDALANRMGGQTATFKQLFPSGVQQLNPLMALLAKNDTGSAPVFKGGGKGVVNRLATQLSKSESSQDLWNRIARFRGGIYDIGGVHHDEGAYERDINVYKGKMRPYAEGQTSRAEQKWLTVLAKAMNKAFGNRSGIEIIFDRWGSQFGSGRNKNPYGDHGSHEHISTPWF